MKRTIAMWVGIITAVVLIGVGYVYWQNTLSAEKQNEAAKQKTVEEQDQPSSVTQAQPLTSASDQPGVFEDYRAEKITQASGTTLLFFHAPWCPQCRMIESDINEQGVPSGVTILKVDYDSNQALRQKYKVTLQTTFIEVDADGTEIERYVAYNEPTFDSVKANLLDE